MLSGETLGPYRVLDKLGEGGMGEVYRATDSNLKRSVAIKVLPAAMAGDADRPTRFQREAEVLAALNHPNIAAIYGFERSSDLIAPVMELVDGEDLSQRIARRAMLYEVTTAAEEMNVTVGVVLRAISSSVSRHRSLNAAHPDLR